MELSDEEWKKRLTPEQYKILRKKGTERAFSGKHLPPDKTGSYTCAGCGQKLFHSDDQFDAGTGWPSFSKPCGKDLVEYADDYKLPHKRIEVLCSNCHGHLGHVFGKDKDHYCINSLVLNFEATS